jgi:hypothetical protein
MAMTEKEAKTKVCPVMTRAWADNGPLLCVGSDCALWVWVSKDRYGDANLEKGRCGLIREPE